ncbi:MAG: response regulator [Candidatus Sumerlaeia bacterium]|nr:response regulator [Candidatus Sumerlaeia bacterium]
MNPIRVLLVEDNPADADLTRETLETGKLFLELSVVADGIAAMDFLHGRGKHIGQPRPDLILLDLNLPRKPGREVLIEIKGDPDLRSIPIVILTSSDAERDIVQSYALGANCYITKPVDLRAFQSIVRTLEGFWLTIVKLPPTLGRFNPASEGSP